MARYLIEKSVTLRPLQEGDYPQDIGFIVPDILDMTGKSAKFSVFKQYDDIATIQKVSPAEITITGQTITVSIVAIDTINNVGSYNWELEVSDANSNITIGKGTIEIIKQRING